MLTDSQKIEGLLGAVHSMRVHVSLKDQEIEHITKVNGELANECKEKQERIDNLGAQGLQNLERIETLTRCNANQVKIIEKMRVTAETVEKTYAPCDKLHVEQMAPPMYNRPMMDCAGESDSLNGKRLILKDDEFCWVDNSPSNAREYPRLSRAQLILACETFSENFKTLVSKSNKYVRDLQENAATIEQQRIELAALRKPVEIPHFTAPRFVQTDGPVPISEDIANPTSSTAVILGINLKDVKIQKEKMQGSSQIPNKLMVPFPHIICHGLPVEFSKDFSKPTVVEELNVTSST